MQEEWNQRGTSCGGRKVGFAQRRGLEQIGRVSQGSAGWSRKQKGAGGQKDTGRSSR